MTTSTGAPPTNVGALLADSGWHVDRSEPGRERYVKDTREIVIHDDFGAGWAHATDGDEEAMLGDLGSERFREDLIKWAFRPEVEAGRDRLRKVFEELPYDVHPDVDAVADGADALHAKLCRFLGSWGRS